MKAFIVDRYGKGSGGLGEMPEPELREDDVLVQVHAAGVNPLDSKIRNRSSTHVMNRWRTISPAEATPLLPELINDHAELFHLVVELLPGDSQGGRRRGLIATVTPQGLDNDRALELFYLMHQTVRKRLCAVARVTELRQAVAEQATVAVPC